MDWFGCLVFYLGYARGTRAIWWLYSAYIRTFHSSVSCDHLAAYRYLRQRADQINHRLPAAVVRPGVRPDLRLLFQAGEHGLGVGQTERNRNGGCTAILFYLTNSKPINGKKPRGCCGLSAKTCVMELRFPIVLCHC